MTLVLGSSLGTTSAVFDRNAPALERHMRLVRYDHRGHGSQPAPPGPWEIADLGRDVLALMDRLGLERASVGGVSLGGMVAMWLAANAPDRVERLVLACTTACFGDPAPWRERARLVRAAGTTAGIADTVVDRWLTPEFAAAQPELRAQLRALLVASPAEGYANACEAIGRMDLRAEIERIAAPTLVVGAARDLATPTGHQEEIARRIAGARLEILDDAAHLANVERPEAFDRLVIDHLEDR
jgi:3-oxoadipate enol-lactonase